MSFSITSFNKTRFSQGYGPLILLGLGLALLIVGVWLVVGQNSITIPARLAGLPLSTQVTGPAALAEIERQHGQSFLLTDGAVARYDNGAITLWISSTWLPFLAGRQVAEMTDRIAEGNSPFTPGEPQQMAGLTVYPLTGLGQAHFYFQHDRQVIWLAAPSQLAEQSLEELILSIAELDDGYDAGAISEADHLYQRHVLGDHLQSLFEPDEPLRSSIKPEPTENREGS